MLTEDKVRKALSGVVDPELGLDIVALGLIYDISMNDDLVAVTMTMTSAACPMHGHLTRLAEDAVRQVAEKTHKVDIHLVFDPPWTPEMMSVEAKKILGYK